MLTHEIIIFWGFETKNQYINKSNADGRQVPRKKEKKKERNLNDKCFMLTPEIIIFWGFETKNQYINKSNADGSH